MTTTFTLRPPTFSSAKAPDGFETPGIPWLMEEWHVTHSSLPMWKDVKNVRTKYTPLPPSSTYITTDNTDRVDDIVTYQKLNSTKVQTVNGVDKAANADSRGEWDWRGNGWLKVASSHWEVLGWGEETDTGNKWVVTMFAKTIFTPAGLDVYSLNRGGLKSETLDGIKSALAAINDSVLNKLVQDLFVVTIDDSRAD